MWARDSVENSVDAFARGVAHGLANECDVRLSADGVPIVIHDQTLDRTTTGRGPVTALHSAQLRALRLRHLTPEQSLPTLAEVCDRVACVEIKQDDAPELVRETIRIMRGRHWLLQSFDPANIEAALAIDPTVTIALLVEDQSQLEFALQRGWRMHIDHILLDDRTAGRLHDAGIDIGVWTVNTPEAVDRVLPQRPLAIISDDPLMVRRRLKRAGVTEA